MPSATCRRQLLQLIVCAGILLAFAPPAPAQPPSPIVERHEGDDYTRYELLAPGSAQFRITYEVTATRPGTRLYFNIIRKGSEASDEAVFDQMTGRPLPWTVVTGAEARAAGQQNADLDANYIQVTLARPVPPGGETRLRIVKTYRDATSYYREGDDIVFNRGLGIRRNAVVLPAGYELAACNVPSQVRTEGDGRIAVSFLNTYPMEAPLVVRARPLPPRAPAAAGGGGSVLERAQARPAPAVSAGSTASRLSERARQDREMVYSSSSPTRMRSRSITTTPNRGRVSAPTTTSFEPGARRRTRRPACSTPARRSRWRH